MKQLKQEILNRPQRLRGVEVREFGAYTVLVATKLRQRARMSAYALLRGKQRGKAVFLVRGSSRSK